MGDIPIVLVNLGMAQILEGDYGAAGVALRECLVAADRIGDRPAATYAYMGLALCASVSGDVSRAITLHGITDAICEELGHRLEPLEKGLAEEDRRRLRQQLAADVFEAALEGGRNIAPVDRLAYALR
jgi:hypothetical protein